MCVCTLSAFARALLCVCLRLSNSLDILAVFHCKIPRQIRRKNHKILLESWQGDLLSWKLSWGLRVLSPLPILITCGVEHASPWCQECCRGSTSEACTSRINLQSSFRPDLLVAQCGATPATVAATPPCSATPFQTQIRCDTSRNRGGGEVRHQNF